MIANGFLGLRWVSFQCNRRFNLWRKRTAKPENCVLGDRLASIADGITALDAPVQITLVANKEGVLEGIHVSRPQRLDTEQ
jgi:hypothetical protein